MLLDCPLPVLMPSMMPGAAGLVMVPEGSPHSTVDCELDLPLCSCPRSIIMREWSLFLKVGWKVSVWVVVTPKLLDELAVVLLLCFPSVSFQPVVLSESGMKVSS